MPDFIYQMHKLNKHYGTRHILKDISLSFFHGAKIGLVGDNGSGKSTLMKIMAGLDQEFVGHAQPVKPIKAALIAQEPVLDQEKTVREVVEEAFADLVTMLREYDQIANSMGELDGEAMDKAMERMGVLQEKIEALDGWNLDTKLKVACNALVLPPDEVPVKVLSGGERRRVALARVLLELPELLLLDEPTNHLDAETVTWLEAQLVDYPGTVIVATHDRYFLDRVTKWILEVDGGRGIPWEGNYTGWLAQKLELLAQNDKSAGGRKRSLERELKWIKMNTEEHKELGRARLADLERFVAKERKDGENDQAIQIAPGPRLGDQILEVQSVTKGYNGQFLFKDLSFTLPKGAIVGIIGPNGTGKTTLFRMITGQETPDAGTITVGPTVTLAYVDQLRTNLNPENTVYQEISEGNDEVMVGKRAVNARSYCAQFNFKGSDQQKKLKDLSGGERNRVHLAKLLKEGGNVLLLDEPTNDLDVNTLRMLEDAINAFDGCVMVISHDRYFLNRVCTHLLIFEGEGQIRWFEGNYEAYEQIRRKEVGDSVFENRRAKYRRLQA
jgi:ATP-binding cassette ChvD family protein